MVLLLLLHCVCPLQLVDTLFWLFSRLQDFIDCAEHLIASGWTEKGRICAQGASAGGLLMGVVMNERPDLWGAVLSQVRESCRSQGAALRRVCTWGGILSMIIAAACLLQVGFVDVLATMSDDTIPLTVTEKEEWGACAGVRAVCLQ